MEIDPDVKEIVDKESQFVAENEEILSNYITWLKQYLVKPLKRRTGVQSNTASPELHSEVEAVTTAIMEMVFSDNTESGFFAALPATADDADLARNAEAVITRELELSKFKKRFLSFSRMLILYGTQVGKIVWNMKRRSVGLPGNRTRKIVADWPEFRYQSMIGFRYDGAARDIDDAGWYSCVIPVSPYEARIMEKNGKWANVQEAISKLSQSSRDTHREERLTMAMDSSQATASRELEIIEYYGTLASKNDSEIYKMTCTKSGVKLTEPELNPYPHGRRPAIKATWIDIGDHFRGVGLGEINSLPLQEKTERKNLMLDAIKRALYHMWVKRAGSGIEDETFIFQPDGIIESQMADGITPLRPDISFLPMALRMDGVSNDEMMRASAAMSTLQAIPLDITATESKTVHQEAVRRIKVYVIANVASFLEDVLLTYHELNTYLLDDDMLTEMVGEDGKMMLQSFNKRHLPMDLRIRLKPSIDVGSRAAMQKNLNEFLISLAALIKSDPRYRLNPMAAIRYTAKNYGMNPNEFVEEMAMGPAMQSPSARGAAMNQMGAQGNGILAEQAARAASAMGI